jgi:hypothetical protein
MGPQLAVELEATHWGSSVICEDARCCWLLDLPSLALAAAPRPSSPFLQLRTAPRILITILKRCVAKSYYFSAAFFAL